MAQFFEIHPDNPQQRLIFQAAEIVRQGGVIVYPTDSSYAIACHIEDKQALDKIRRIRQLDDKHNFTLACKDLAQVSNFTKMGNDAFRLIKSLIPGPFTFILDATREVPRRLQRGKKKTIGIRVPDNKIALRLIEALGEPLFTSTMVLPGETEALSDPYEIRQRLEHELDLVIDAGIIDYQPTTIIDCHDNHIEIIRQGAGQADMLG
jgi:tRNA threonylcarbamoyl adenosine modification protein (Sua5/YciO/YrdC/YwlC family)